MQQIDLETSSNSEVEASTKLDVLIFPEDFLTLLAFENEKAAGLDEVKLFERGVFLTGESANLASNYVKHLNLRLGNTGLVSSFCEVGDNARLLYFVIRERAFAKYNEDLGMEPLGVIGQNIEDLNKWIEEQELSDENKLPNPYRLQMD